MHETSGVPTIHSEVLLLEALAENLAMASAIRKRVPFQFTEGEDEDVHVLDEQGT